MEIKEQLLFIKKKVIYLNIMYAFAFLFGATLVLLGFTPIGNTQNHFVLIETFAGITIGGSLGFWYFETRSYHKMKFQLLQQLQKEHTNEKSMKQD